MVPVTTSSQLVYRWPSKSKMPALSRSSTSTARCPAAGGSLQFFSVVHSLRSMNASQALILTQLQGNLHVLGAIHHTQVYLGLIQAHQYVAHWCGRVAGCIAWRSAIVHVGRLRHGKACALEVGAAAQSAASCRPSHRASGVAASAAPAASALWASEAVVTALAVSPVGAAVLSGSAALGTAVAALPWLAGWELRAHRPASPRAFISCKRFVQRVDVVFLVQRLPGPGRSPPRRAPTGERLANSCLASHCHHRRCVLSVPQPARGWARRNSSHGAMQRLAGYHTKLDVTEAAFQQDLQHAHSAPAACCRYLQHWQLQILQGCCAVSATAPEPSAFQA